MKTKTFNLKSISFRAMITCAAIFFIGCSCGNPSREETIGTDQSKTLYTMVQSDPAYWENGDSVILRFVVTSKTEEFTPLVPSISLPESESASFRFGGAVATVVWSPDSLAYHAPEEMTIKVEGDFISSSDPPETAPLSHRSTNVYRILRDVKRGYYIKEDTNAYRLQVFEPR